MISKILSGAFRTVQLFATCSTSKTSNLWGITTNIQRNVHSNPFQQIRLPPNVRKAVEKNMGPRPKHPLSPYFRFMEQTRPQIKAEYPHLKSNQLFSIFSERWKSVEPERRAILSAEYKNDMDKYLKEIWEYNSRMSSDDMQQIEEELSKTEEKKQIKLYQKKARELQKPERPVPPFLKFMHSKSDRKPGEPYKDYMKRMSSTWKSLSETERIKYKTKPKELENYQNAKLEWEASLTKLIAYKDDDSF